MNKWLHLQAIPCANVANAQAPLPHTPPFGPMRLIISFTALFLSILLLQISSGGVGPLDALSGLEAGFSRGAVGFLGSMHFVGFFLGCWWAPRLMGIVGHSRAFAVFTSMGAIGIAGHILIMDPLAWAILRIGRVYRGLLHCGRKLAAGQSHK